MKKLICLICAVCGVITVQAKNYDNPDTLFVARDGTAEFRNVSEAIEVCRAFMEYHKVIYVKKGVYKEKLVIPQWLTNIEICGEDRDQTIITWDDHANIKADITPLTTSGAAQKIGTFRTFTLKIQGSKITLKNITIENNSARLGQAVALHTEGDRLTFVNCRFLGHQDTIYTGNAKTRLYFKDCYIEGTTDFIFGPSSIARYSARPTHISRQPLHHRTSRTGTYLIIVASAVLKVLTRSIWDVLGATMAIHCS